MSRKYVQYRFDSFLIDTARRELLNDGRPVIVQARVFDLLAYLAEHRGHVVDKVELQDAVWPGRVITDAAMSRAVMKARQALGDDADDPKIVKTVYGRGFRFVADVETSLVTGLGREDSSTMSLAGIPKRQAVITSGLVAALIVLLAAGRFWWSSAANDTTGTLAGQDNSSTIDALDDFVESTNSIVVLPFVNISDDIVNEYFSDGISEELINLLAQTSGLRVISRTSAFSLKGKDLSARDIARHLNVAHILEGSVRKSGNQVRITAQLIDARSDTHLWSNTYDRTLEDIFAVQDNIASAVVESLKLTRIGNTGRHETVNSEAYAMVLQARHLSLQVTPVALETAEDILQRALDIEPDYADAWAVLAAVYATQSGRGLRPIGDGYALARRAANRALAIDSSNAHAHRSLGRISQHYDRDFAAAALHYQAALASDPINSIGDAASFAASLGRLEQAVEFARYAVSHDPVAPLRSAQLGFFHYLSGSLEEAVVSYETTLALSPNFVAARYFIGISMLLNGEADSALAVINDEIDEAWRLAGLAIIYSALGREDESWVALNALIEDFESEMAYNIAYVYAYLNLPDQAFEWLDTAVEYNDPGLAEIINEPMFANVRSDSRWLPFLQSIGKSTEDLRNIRFDAAIPEP